MTTTKPSKKVQSKVARIVRALLSEAAQSQPVKAEELRNRAAAVMEAAQIILV